MKSTDIPQDLFHPLVAEWFSTRFETPTEIQRLAWPPITRRANVLVTAPTGTGKTLTVFLSAIDRLIRGESETGAIRVLYISPLKALNNDIRENLIAPLRELQSLFESRETPFPDIRVVVRSGDTPQSERQRMLRKPPEILITTPESLNLLLSSPKARVILSTIDTVILDEIHAVAAGKRGTHLITAVERLVLLAGEFQRIAVSATVKPVELIADFVGGYRIERGADGPIYIKRNVEVAQSTGSKELELKIEYPLKDMQLGGYDTVWNLIAGPVRQIVKDHKSTLIFVNSRRLAENLTHIINQNGEMLAYAHHGSLSRELRHIVEKRLKAGELSAIVATTSLEMGIDIGNLDKVILIQTPFSVSSAVQRIGRAGHTVHQVSSGVVFPSHGMDLVHAAVIANLVMEKDVEDVHPVRCPLDVLSQILLSMLGIAAWNLDELFAVIRGSYAFHELREKEYRSVLDMLAGRYRDARIRELKPRIMIDEVTNIGRAHNGALHLIYMSGGTIPDRGYFSMRVHGSLSRVGELDEEFVWERKTGDTFTLGTQSWKIMKMDHQKVEVIPWKGPVKIQPFWKAEGVNRDFHYSRKISAFLENWNDRLEDPELPLELQARHALDDKGSEALISFLKHQRKSSGVELPHRHHILVEHSFDPSTGTDLQTVFIHTLWGNRVNYPLALVLAALWERDHYPVEVMSDNDVVVVQLPHDEVFRDTSERSYELPIGELLSSIVIDEIGDLIRSRLEKGAFFGARFRENAGRALLLPRSGVSRRTPLWVNRLKAKKLMEAVRSYQDFPILLETWRTCIQDELDIDSLKMLLEEIGSGEISISEISTTKPSPFADGAIWQSTNKHLYGDDTPVGHDSPSVDPNVLKEAVFSPHIRPALDAELVRIFSSKLGRTEEGYSPRGPEELTDWVGERLLIPLEEWNRLLEAMERDHGLPREELLDAVASRCGLVHLPKATEASVVSLSGLVRLIISLDLRIDDIKITPIIEQYDTNGFRKDLARLLDRRKSANFDLDDDYSAESVLSQWLVYAGPVPVDSIGRSFGFSASDVNDLLSLLTESKIVVVDRLTEGTEVEEVCDAENLERILGFSRRQKRSGVQESFDPLPPRDLQPFLARWQRLSRRGENRVADPAARSGQCLRPGPCLTPSEAVRSILCRQR
ncbi:MAG: DEAD/DEAH box helicase [Spirochaetales bacterium]|nr:DEAD/DEAH box helicase [Spirochaetales bacterium]